MSDENSRGSTAGAMLRASTGPVIILAIAVYFYSLACCIGPTPMGQLGAGFWPKMILIFLMLGCVVKVGENIRDRHILAQVTETRPKMDNVKLTLMIVLLIATVFAIDFIGFALSNFLFMVAFLFVVGLRKIPSLLLISSLGTVAMLYVFVKLVYLPLPRGMGIFEDISLFIYRGLHIM